MTVYQSIPSAGVLEAFAPGFTHTSVTRRFGVMQRALGAWIEAERDLEHVNRHPNGPPYRRPKGTPLAMW